MVKSRTKCLINYQVHTNRIVGIVKHTRYNTFNAVVVFALVLCFFVSSGGTSAEGLRVSGAFKPNLPDVAPQVNLAFARPYIFEYKVYLPRTTSVERDKFHSISTIGPQKIGIHRDLPERYRGELKHSLTWRKRDDGIVAYLLVHSPDAESVRFLADLSLPVGASLNFYEITTTPHISVIHSYDVHAQELEESSRFWSPIASGESIGVEIWLPDEASKEYFELKLLKIAHGYERSFTAATNVQECTNHIDVQCAIDDGDISEESVSTSMRLRYESEDVTYACSGTILNVPNDGEDVWIPYIMTAEHCISTSAEADSVVAYWNYQYEQCGGTSLSSDYTSTPGGADLLATYPEGDQTLIRLRNDAPAGTFFSGWWVTDVETGETGICSGHPTPGIKKFFSGTTTGNFDVSVCADEDGNDCELLVDLIQLELESGAIEGGASGSALRINHPDDNKDYFVGVLSAKSTDHPSCEGGVGYFGEFQHFYPDVAQWLGAETEPAEPDDVHGDTEDTATVIELHSETEGYINDENDIDYFEITVEQVGTLVIYTTGSIDTTGSVTNEDGSVDLTDEDSGNDLNFLINFAADPGTYSIKVEGNQSSTGSYILVVEFEVHNEQNDDLDDHGDTEDTATPLELDSTTVGEIDDEEDIDYFEIVIDRAGTLKIYTTGDLDTTGTVTNEDGTVDIFDDDSGADLNFSITLNADAGTYFIKVEGHSTSTGEYTLHTEFEAHDDHGDTKESATTISSSARNWKFSTVAYINDAFDQDVFELVFSRKTKITIYTEGETDTVGRLTNLNDVDIVEDDDICDENDEDCEENLNFSLTYTVDEGTYYLYVSGEITEKSEYTLKIETDAGQVSE